MGYMYKPGICKEEGIQSSKSDGMGQGQDLTLGHKEHTGSTGEVGVGRDKEKQKVEVKKPSPSGNDHRNQNPGLQTQKTQTNRSRTSNRSQLDLAACQAREIRQ